MLTSVGSACNKSDINIFRCVESGKAKLWLALNHCVFINNVLCVCNIDDAHFKWMSCAYALCSYCLKESEWCLLLFYRLPLSSTPSRCQKNLIEAGGLLYLCSRWSTAIKSTNVLTIYEYDNLHASLSPSFSFWSTKRRSAYHQWMQSFDTTKCKYTIIENQLLFRPLVEWMSVSW